MKLKIWLEEIGVKTSLRPDSPEEIKGVVKSLISKSV